MSVLVAAAAASATVQVNVGSLPDVVIDAIRWSENDGGSWHQGTIQSGSDVWFEADVRNQGTGPTPSGIILGVSFHTSTGGAFTTQSWSDTHTTALDPSQTVSLRANFGPSGTKFWQNAADGVYTIRAHVDDVGRIEESDETNNILDVASVTVGSGESEVLPFNMPDRATLRASTQHVAAHWHNFPREFAPDQSYYINEYINPNGEGGIHYNYGGYMASMPLPLYQFPLTGDWVKQHMRLDIEEAAAIGIDAFYKNSWTDLPNDANLIALFDAADEFNADNATDFYIAIELDAVIIGSGASATTWADRVAPFLDRQSYYTYNGNYVVPVFNGAIWNVAWYQDFAARILATEGKNVVFFPSFNIGPTSAMDPYLSIIPELFPVINIWNIYDIEGNPADHSDIYRTYVNNAGAIFQGSTQMSHANRPGFHNVENFGVQRLSHGWLGSILNGDPMMQIQTWNDHWEEHGIRPNTAYQYAAYDLTAYYLTWFKMEAAPTIVRDVLYYAHRMHLTSASYDTGEQTSPFVIQTPPTAVNNIYVTTFLTAPGDVKITTTSTTTHAGVAAGVNTVTAPLVGGNRPSFELERSAVSVIGPFDSAFATRSSVVWQDFLYRWGSSTRPPVPGVQDNLPEDRLA